MDNPTPSSRLFLIGSEASRAFSPGLWNPALKGLGSGWTYEAWDVPREVPMSGVRARLLDSDVVAANVTMPHKHWAAEAADTATEAVRLSGASNLLIRHGRTLEAHNTDVAAAAELLGGRHQRHAVMLGAGGAARAALVALKGLAVRVSVADRDPEAARQLGSLAASLGMDAEAVPWAEAQDRASRASLIVNATPVGKRVDDPPAWGGARLAGDAFVYDFVYAGHVTGTIAAAREQGLRCADGWEHLRAQATAMVPLLGLPPRADALLRSTLAALQARS
jgi:shikimate dehydrogenase